MAAPTIFQVEDDEDFVFLMDYAIKEINMGISLKVSANGRDGIKLLDQYQAANEMPGMILLDINLPGMSGIDVLKLIRDTAFYDRVPVIIFSTSDNPRDIETALQFGANEYQTKPLGYRALVNSLKGLKAKYINT